MKIFNKIKLLPVLLLLSLNAFSDEDTLSQIETVLVEKSDIKILIVGCGKNPFKWAEAEPGVNQWRKSQGTERHGIHEHLDAITIAEDPNVEPDIVWDFTIEIPAILENRFDIVYFERLPPLVLSQSQIWQNALRTLKPSGVLISEFQQAVQVAPGSSDAYAEAFVNILGSKILENKGKLKSYLLSKLRLDPSKIDNALTDKAKTGTLVCLALESEAITATGRFIEEQGFSHVEFQNHSGTNPFNHIVQQNFVFARKGLSCSSEGCENEGSSACGSCGKAFYCSRECQKACWNEHKKYCKKYLRTFKDSKSTEESSAHGLASCHIKK